MSWRVSALIFCLLYSYGAWGIGLVDNISMGATSVRGQGRGRMLRHCRAHDRIFSESFARQNAFDVLSSTFMKKGRVVYELTEAPEQTFLSVFSSISFFENLRSATAFAHQRDPPPIMAVVPSSSSDRELVAPADDGSHHQLPDDEHPRTRTTFRNRGGRGTTTMTISPQTVITIVAVVESMDQALVTASFKAFERSFGFSPRQLGLLLSTQGVAFSLLLPIWGVLIPSHGCRKLLSVGCWMWYRSQEFCRLFLSLPASHKGDKIYTSLTRTPRGFVWSRLWGAAMWGGLGDGYSADLGMG